MHCCIIIYNNIKCHSFIPDPTYIAAVKYTIYSCTYHGGRGDADGASHHEHTNGERCDACKVDRLGRVLKSLCELGSRYGCRCGRSSHIAFVAVSQKIPQLLRLNGNVLVSLLPFLLSSIIGAAAAAVNVVVVVVVFHFLYPLFHVGMKMLECHAGTAAAACIIVIVVSNNN